MLQQDPHESQSKMIPQEDTKQCFPKNVVTCLNLNQPQGQYNHILRRIFLLLDGSSLRCSELVCSEWRRFVRYTASFLLLCFVIMSISYQMRSSVFHNLLFSRAEVWGHPESRQLLERGWRTGIPASRRLELGARCVALRCDEVRTCDMSHV